MGGVGCFEVDPGAGVVTVGDDRLRGEIPHARPVGLVGALAERGLQLMVGAGERGGELGAQLHGVATVELVLDLGQFTDSGRLSAKPCH
jgi:hypothetical protein